MTPLLSPKVAFFFNDTATTEIYTLSLHDALPISACSRTSALSSLSAATSESKIAGSRICTDRKSTRLNSSHHGISYAASCLKQKKTYQPRFPAPPQKKPRLNHPAPPYPL